MSPELELQGVLVQALKASVDVSALVDDRVYDTVPMNAELPYISLGPMIATSDDAECITGFEIMVQIDSWSQAVGLPECKRIVDAVRVTLHDADLAMGVNALVMIEHQTSNVSRDPDGITNHGMSEFVAFVERK
jgi:hypothetical protein